MLRTMVPAAPGVRTTPRARARRVEPALVARAAGGREGQLSSGADSSAQPPPRAARPGDSKGLLNSSCEDAALAPLACPGCSYE